MRQQGNASPGSAGASTRETIIVCAVAAAALTFGLAFSPSPKPEGRWIRQAVASPVPPAFEPSRFVLNALLIPALDADAVPLRWVDPRPAMSCGDGTTVHVNGEPLQVGARVPDVPFEIDWQADGCRPFGIHGPRFDGQVRLTVFREDWGFSALVAPSGLHIAWADREIALQRGAAVVPQFAEDDEQEELILVGAQRSLH